MPAPVDAELSREGLTLVADDQEVVRNMVVSALARWLQGRACVRWSRAVDLFSRRPNEYSAILLDMTMPALSGEDVLRAVRMIRTDVPVVVSSGYAEVEAMTRFEGLLPAGFLQKPYTATTLLRKIRQAVRSTAVMPG